METHDDRKAKQVGEEDSNCQDDLKPCNSSEWGGGGSAVTEQRYVYSDHSQERLDPSFYDPSFSDLFQTPDQKRKLPAKLNEMLSDPGKIGVRNASTYS